MKLAIGSAQIGMSYGIANDIGQVDQVGAKKILEFAASQGIDTIDTAIAYGSSEKCLGAIGVHNYKVITKLPPLPEFCEDVCTWAYENITGSISRLGCNYVYGLMLHHPVDLLGASGCDLYAAIKAIKNEGLVKKIGASIYSPTELDVILSEFELDIIQAPFNIVDQRLLMTGWLDQLKKYDIEIHTRSSFLQGLLLIPREKIPKQFSRWNPLWDYWSDWLQERDILPAKVCIDFVQSFEQIDRIIVGVNNVAQLNQLVAFSMQPLNLEFPIMMCNDENLINPVNWSRLEKS